MNYQREALVIDDDDTVFTSPQKTKRNSRGVGSGSDTDFAAAGESGQDDDSELEAELDLQELQLQRRSGQGTRNKFKVKSPRTPRKKIVPKASRSVSAKKSTPKAKVGPRVRSKDSPRKRTPQVVSTPTNGRKSHSRRLVFSSATTSGTASKPLGKAHREARAWSPSKGPRPSPSGSSASGKATLKKQSPNGTKLERLETEVLHVSDTQQSSAKQESRLVDKSSMQASASHNHGFSRFDMKSTDNIGEAQGAIASSLNTSQMSPVSPTSQAPQKMICQSDANEALSQTSTDSLQTEQSSPKI